MNKRLTRSLSHLLTFGFLLLLLGCGTTPMHKPHYGEHYPGDGNVQQCPKCKYPIEPNESHLDYRVENGVKVQDYVQQFLCLRCKYEFFTIKTTPR